MRLRFLKGHYWHQWTVILYDMKCDPDHQLQWSKDFHFPSFKIIQFFKGLH